MARSSFFSRFNDWLKEWDDSKTRQVLVVLLGVLAGLLIGMLTYTIAKYFIETFPIGAYLGKPDEKTEVMKNATLQVFISVPLTWAIGAFAGGFCAARVGNVGQFPAWIAGILMTAYFWIDMLEVPNMNMLYVVCLVLVGLFTFGGGWLGTYVSAQRRLRAEV